MRALALVLALLLVTPLAAAGAVLPERWSAFGHAAWQGPSPGAPDQEGTGTPCGGEIATRAVGPVLVGEHAGMYRFRVDVQAAQPGCESFAREGWIHDPHADSTQLVRADDAGATLVRFSTDESGARTIELYDYDAARELALASVIAERSGVF
ncbi:MAG TPA: hypothetical protein VM370_11760 [Candidatus Thermoplasmatota archaeon]|nr:hypothetical protein [Candidatus Thermoplasmatota archaeon]